LSIPKDPRLWPLDGAWCEQNNDLVDTVLASVELAGEAPATEGLIAACEEALLAVRRYRSSFRTPTELP
jgi:hypothetical protein